MSVLDRMRDLFTPSPSPALIHLPGPGGRVLDALKGVIDPEVGLDIVNLGLIRRVEVEGEEVFLGMTLTTAGCPMAATILDEVEQALLCRGWQPHIEWTFEPPWSPDHISPAGKSALAAAG